MSILKNKRKLNKNTDELFVKRALENYGHIQVDMVEDLIPATIVNDMPISILRVNLDELSALNFHFTVKTSPRVFIARPNQSVTETLVKSLPANILSAFVTRTLGADSHLFSLYAADVCELVKAPLVSGIPNQLIDSTKAKKIEDVYLTARLYFTEYYKELGCDRLCLNASPARQQVGEIDFSSYFK